MGMFRVNFRKNIRGVLKLIMLCVLVVNVLFNYVEFYTAKKHIDFSKDLLNKSFYDKMYGNNEEFILSVINSNEYICNVFKYDLFIAVALFFFMLVLIVDY